MLTLLALVACKTTPTEPVDSDVPSETDVPVDDTDIPEPEGDPATVELLGTCTRAERWGGFVIDNGVDFAFVDGSVLDAVVPATVPEPVDASGNCSLDRRVNPFCDPPCPGDQTCNNDSVCIPYPSSQDLGTIEVAGTNPPVRIDPFVPGYNYSNTQVSNPPIDADTLAVLRMPDSPWGAIDLHAVGVEPLQTPSDTLIVRDDADLEVTWTAATGLARSNVYFELNIDQHGNSPILLSCEWPDSGAGTVPVGLIQQLINAGVTGFPSARIVRRTADKVAVGTDGCVDLRATSPRVRDVNVDGFTPCNGPGQCPDGQECNIPFEICE